MAPASFGKPFPKEAGLVEEAMGDAKGSSTYVRVKDAAGNEFFCPLEALKEPQEMSAEEMENCVDDATVKRYSGNIEVKEE